MSFAPGDTVTHLKLKKEGVVEQDLGKKRYRVCIGSLSVTCKESELEKVAEQQAKTRPARKQHRPQKAPSHRVPEFDLHRHTAQEATERVIAVINESIMKGEPRIHLVHGHGTGKVKGAVHKVLSSLDVVKSFEISRNNSGVTVVYL